MEQVRIDLPNGGGWLVYHRAPAGTAELDDINVYTRRKGWGRRLVEQMLAQIPDVKTVFCFTRGSNYDAQKFYEALKFIRFCDIDLFYHDGTPDDKRGVLYVLRRYP